MLTYWSIYWTLIDLLVDSAYLPRALPAVFPFPSFPSELQRSARMCAGSTFYFASCPHIRQIVGSRYENQQGWPPLARQASWRYISKLYKNFLTFWLVQVNKSKSEKVWHCKHKKRINLEDFAFLQLFQLFHFLIICQKSTFSKKTSYFGIYSTFRAF